MKFYSITLALALLLGHVPQTLAKPNTGATGNEQDATHGAPTSEEEPPSNRQRYVVKFKKGSSDYNARLKNAKNNAKRGQGNGGQGNDNDRGKSGQQGNRGKTRNSPPVQERGNDLFPFGNFLPKANAEVIYLDSDNDKKEYEQRDDVEYIELDHKVYLMNESVPFGIERVKALLVPDTDVSNRKVCIVDTGFDITHPDLTSDTNVVTGYEGDASAGPSAWSYDGHGHGTHVAGTIAAIGGNGQGVVGVNRNGQVKLHIVKVFGDDGNWAWGSSLVAAVEACVDGGANIVSMSLGGGGFSQTESDAYDRISTEDNVLLVAAAGNDGNTAYSYPASYTSVMSVAATDSNNNVAGFSQKNDQVDIAAPGVAIQSTLPSHVASSGYAAWSGTSMATPHVSGVAALVWSLDTTRTAAEIRQALEASAQDLGVAGRDDSYGHGLVRADLAAAYLNSGFTLSPTAAPTPAPPCTDNPEGWYDIDGATYNCAWYAQGTNCATYGDSFANNGITANMACCVCGGGAPDGPPATATPTASPTANPTPSPTPPPTCGDEPQWHDSDGVTFGCEWYAQKTNCAVYGDNYENYGKTANAACCVCGGGADTPSPTAAPTVAATADPTVSPTVAATQCTDDPEGWFDSDGSVYNCEWYGQSSHCAWYGDSYANLGKTANEACCVCGGGSFS